MTCPSSCRDPHCNLSYRDHLLTVAISAAATPSRRPEVVRIDNTEARWHRDMDEYKTLRRQGYQPEHIDGCADLAARATTDAQIEGRPEGVPA